MSATTIHIFGVVSNFLLLVFLLVIILFTVDSYNSLQTCQGQENLSCYMFTCPNIAYKTCGNAAYREDNGKIYCSSAPATVVN